MIKKQQTDEVEHSSPKSESDSQSEDSAMDGCLPFYFCTYYFSSRITTSRVSSPVKPAPMIDILDDEHNGIRNSEIDSCYPRTSQHQVSVVDKLSAYYVINILKICSPINSNQTSGKVKGRKINVILRGKIPWKRKVKRRRKRIKMLTT